MQTILTEPVRGPVAWSGRELERDERWIWRLTPPQLAEIEDALAAVRARGLAPEEMVRADFPLPNFERELASISGELENGTGITLIRGLPVDRYDETDVARILWGLGTYLGTAIAQNANGDLVGHVRHVGMTLANPNARGYQTREAQSLHVDRCDVVGLLCLRKAHSGGISRVVSSIRLYNELLARYPWYIGILYKPFAVDMRGEEQPGESPVYYRPVYSYYEGRLSCGCNATYIRSGQEKIGSPLTPVESDALDTFYRVAEEITLSMDLEPGDLQLLNSYVTLHDRSAYEDDPDPARRRHLLRLWLSVPNRRPLAPDFGTYIFPRKQLA